jgi:iron complex transport system ATP-binding protein
VTGLPLPSLAPRLTITDVSAGYGRKPVLQGLTLDPIGPGHITALVGPNGAGKSTLLRVLAGLLPASGSVRLGDRELIGASVDAHATHVSFMPQLLPQRIGLTVFEGVIAALKASPFGNERLDNATIRRRGIEVLERVGIADLALEPIGHLSGGQRQLASLAQAIVREPAVLLLDEPTSALDLGHQVRVMGLVHALAAEGRIVVAVVHDLALAARWAGHVVVLHHGRLDAAGSPADAITPSVLGRVYGVAARVEPCSHGTLQVIVDGPVP